MTAQRARRARSVAVGIGAGLLVVAAALSLGAYLAPRVLPNLFTEVFDEAHPQTVIDAGARATVVVPAGWASQRAWGSESELVLRSPDGGLAVTFTISPDAAQPTVASDDASGGDDAVVERLASGLDAAHAQTDDALVLAVGRGAAEPSMRIVATGTREELAPYRPVIADLIESVRVGS
ncbi:hypothetical protein [Microbacterium hatanonis]|uniref:DUF4245 domain-containing protein n=1 Tax=Microbacterium hatanonis TaxID=404366 RepID=A0A5C8I5X7_9MICO|nr:hypothetical protein [Microbacterium hatanonis]TXK13699.1 hypothetical protein FVP77_10095 [Microbacterium hatanonis]